MIKDEDLIIQIKK